MKEKVLLVDNDPELLEVLSELLKDLVSDLGIKIEIETAYDGQQALDRLNQEHTGMLLVTDLRMHPNTGYDLLAWLKDHPCVQVGLGVIVFTGEWDLKPEMRTYLAMGVVKRVIQKPAIDDLLGQIKEMVGGCVGDHQYSERDGSGAAA